MISNQTVLGVLMLAGTAQAALVGVGLGLPVILGWPAEFRRLSLLTRQTCWAHFVYLLAGNASLAVVALFAPLALLTGSALAFAATLFAAGFASSRLLLQLFVFDRGLTRVNAWYKFGEISLMLVYSALATGYGLAAWVNLRGAL